MFCVRIETSGTVSRKVIFGTIKISIFSVLCKYYPCVSHFVTNDYGRGKTWKVSIFGDVFPE